MQEASIKEKEKATNTRWRPLHDKEVVGSWDSNQEAIVVPPKIGKEGHSYWSFAVIYVRKVFHFFLRFTASSSDTSSIYSP
ncbi:hypothetical protein C0Q70_08229 [Pomacea canaliculata]|uniref:Uncharacterized protein n=1 Tax=Pomacea canaliculata TaxID=400727 RepID=A0A2T7PH82_POMCA|nr:hypothetical protein C0Q70_08229 [Pomacea canaliculata]